MGGAFTLSDDSHGVDQVGTNYARLLAFIEEIGIERITYFEKGAFTRDERFPGVGTKTVAVEEIKQHPVFS